MADAQTNDTQVDAQQHTMQEAANKAAGIWDDDFSEEELTVPLTREEKDAKGTDEKTEEDPKDSTAGNDKVEEEPVEVYSDPAPVVTVEDPGDYTPADYSFEVTLKDGKTVKITTPEDAEELSDDPENFETPRQLLDFIKKTTQMQNKLDKDYDKWELQKKTFDEQTATAAERQQNVDNLTKGFEYLISKGLMPQIDPADAIADWNDPEVAKHDGVKEQIALINYMVKENASRAKAGIPVLSSALDAFNAWQLDTNRQQEEQEHKAAGEARRAAGARVAGTSASNAAPYVPKGISVGRVIPMRGAANWE